MIIKINQEKAYDRLSWGFIRETLTLLLFLPLWVRYIPTLSVLWNGRKLESFSPCRGIRQGAAISPYIFVLCMERLGHLINASVQSGQWKPVKLSKSGPSISPFFFL